MSSLGEVFQQINRGVSINSAAGASLELARDSLNSLSSQIGNLALEMNTLETFFYDLDTKPSFRAFSSAIYHAHRQTILAHQYISKALKGSQDVVASQLIDYISKLVEERRGHTNMPPFVLMASKIYANRISSFRHQGFLELSPHILEENVQAWQQTLASVRLDRTIKGKSAATLRIHRWAAMYMNKWLE